MITKNNNEIVWLESEMLNQLGVAHGFFGRLGGVSSEPFASLNVKHQDQENMRAVDQNRMLICQSLHLAPRELQFASLCHGNQIANCSGAEHGMTYVGTDCLITNRELQPLMLSVADCVPLILSDGVYCAVVHVGWRGAENKIVDKTLDDLRDLGADLSKIAAAIGPAIAMESYEVGKEVYEIFADDYSKAVEALEYSYRLGVSEVVESQLKARGVSQIDRSDVDVYRHNDEWFSARKGDLGRNAVIAAIRK